jgi:hypothetical protein
MLSVKEQMALAKHTEDYIAKLLKRKIEPFSFLGSYALSEGADKEKDITYQIMGMEDVLVEVKDNPGCIETGNVFIEYECSGVDSGISATNAQYWVIIAYDKTERIIILIEIEALRRLTYRYASHRRSCGNARGILIPYKEVLSNGQRIE